MRLGGPIHGHDSPEDWVHLHRQWRYRAAYSPVQIGDDEQAIAAYVAAAGDADVVIAEVGAWVNVLDRNDTARRAAIRTCQERLALADRIGARCVANIAGSRGERWDGPDPEDLSEETFDLIVETVREIIDAVRPTRARYALETMPWMLPDSAETAVALVHAVGRAGFGIHFDPVNLINSPRRFFGATRMVRDFVERLGPHIPAVHLKDVRLEPKLTVHLQEVRPGLGQAELGEWMRVFQDLIPEVPVLLEHLPSEEEYRLANAHVQAVAREVGVPL